MVFPYPVFQLYVNSNLHGLLYHLLNIMGDLSLCTCLCRSTFCQFRWTVQNSLCKESSIFLLSEIMLSMPCLREAIVIFHHPGVGEGLADLTSNQNLSTNCLYVLIHFDYNFFINIQWSLWWLVLFIDLAGPECSDMNSKIILDDSLKLFLGLN